MSYKDKTKKREYMRNYMKKYDKTPQRRKYKYNWQKKNKLKINKIHNIWRKKQKQKLDDYKKDKCCLICGYKEHTEILQFHHIKDKVVKIGHVNWSADALIKKEIPKCILLCPNCHMWLHKKDKVY